MRETQSTAVAVTALSSQLLQLQLLVAPGLTMFMKLPSASFCWDWSPSKSGRWANELPRQTTASNDAGLMPMSDRSSESVSQFASSTTETCYVWHLILCVNRWCVRSNKTPDPMSSVCTRQVLPQKLCASCYCGVHIFECLRRPTGWWSLWDLHVDFTAIYAPKQFSFLERWINFTSKLSNVATASN